MRFTIFTALLFVALIVPNLHAQSNQLEQSQMAVVSFDINLDKIRNSEMSKKLDLESQIKRIAPNSDRFDPQKVKRVFGASSAPESMEATKEYKGKGPLPVEFFARVEMVDSAAADQTMEMFQENGEAVEIGGKTYYKSTHEKAPDELLVHRFDDSTVEIGTKAYMLTEDRKVFTDGLTAAFEKAPKEAVRIAMDLEGAPELVAEFQELAAEKGPANLAAVYELISLISDMHITIDMDGANLLTIGMAGKSESEAQKLEEGLGSLLMLGQMMGMGQVGQLKQMSPELGDKAEEILKALKAEREGENVQIKLIHPDGFADAIKAMMGR